MKDVFTDGPGPFVTPLLARLVDLRVAEGAGHCLVEFALEDGARITLPIANPAAYALADVLAVYCARSQKPPASTS